ncbi:hypothetical protein GCM10008943_30790 [Paenochrobactrum glaciei]|uniref:Uncharacterized protein n=1 Tax=Paenochrobactrum glaciei TaxID=486407 RepID=A0ABN1GKR4_9HYPH
MTSKEVERFIEECRFAKIVDTADGQAIRIGSDIINIRSANPELHIEGITVALRQSLQGASCDTNSSVELLQRHSKTGACPATQPHR